MAITKKQRRQEADVRGHIDEVMTVYRIAPRELDKFRKLLMRKERSNHGGTHAKKVKGRR